MNRTLVLLSAALATLFFGACSPSDSIVQFPQESVTGSAEKRAAPAEVPDAPVWPLGVAP